MFSNILKENNQNQNIRNLFKFLKHQELANSRLKQKGSIRKIDPFLFVVIETKELYQSALPSSPMQLAFHLVQIDLFDLQIEWHTKL